MPESYNMLQEISEEAGIINSWKDQFSGDFAGLSKELMNGNTVYLTGSGTSFHAALYASIVLSQRGITTVPFPASEYRSFISGRSRVERKVLIAFSQSGESSDIMNSVRYWKERGGKVSGVTNDNTSSLHRLSEYPIYTNVGVEKALAATKTHLAQILFGASLSSEKPSSRVPFDVEKISGDVLKILNGSNRIRDLAGQKTHNIVVLGSMLNYPLALEGALKIKETSSSVSEGYATREFLHGPKQTLTNESLVLMLSSSTEVREDINKVARVLDVTEFLHDNYLIDSETEVGDSICKLVFLQLFAFNKALSLGANPDTPTLLTKVVK